MTDRLRHADLLQIHPVADGYVVRHPSSGVLHHLNGTAALLFELCDGRATGDEVAAKVRQTFGLTPAQLRTVRSGLETLRRNGLVVAAPLSGPATGRSREARARRSLPSPRPETAPRSSRRGSGAARSRR